MAGRGRMGIGLGPGRGLMSQRLFRSPLSPFPGWPAGWGESCANQNFKLKKYFFGTNSCNRKLDVSLNFNVCLVSVFKRISCDLACLIIWI